MTLLSHLNLTIAAFLTEEDEGEGMSDRVVIRVRHWAVEKNQSNTVI